MHHIDLGRLLHAGVQSQPTTIRRPSGVPARRPLEGCDLHTRFPSNCWDGATHLSAEGHDSVSMEVAELKG
jgi:hypothetical protein